MCIRDSNHTLYENYKELMAKCLELHKILAQSQLSLHLLEERVIRQEIVTHNGQLLWRLTNIKERMDAAKGGYCTAIYSPLFYTSDYGYKLCAKLYFNGDGSGLNTHLSLFFVVLRGDYDALLTWPFRQKVAFSLMDQSEARRHHVDAFKPNPNSASFKRPESDMNVASGLPQFCLLEKLTSPDFEFIKNNCIFIKVIVDTSDLSLLI